MEAIPLPKVLFGQDRVIRFPKSIQIHFAQKRQVLSTSPYHGGYREDLTAVFNFDETPEKGKNCVMRAPTYEEHMRLITEELGLDPAHSAGLSTAAHMKYAVPATMSYRSISVTAIVTGGINKNGGRAGDPAGWDEEAQLEKHQTGTVNILLAIGARLSEGAMTKAVITATEAKTAAIQELLAQSCCSSGLATGTGTDGIIVIANPQSEHYLTDAGQHSRLGELIGKTVHEAVKQALYLQTGLGYQQQHNVFRRMGRYGVTEAALLARFQRSSPTREELRRYRRVLKEIATQDELVVYTSLYAHLLDQLEWGMLRENEALKGAEALFTLMGMVLELDESHEKLIHHLARQYQQGLYRKSLDWN